MPSFLSEDDIEREIIREMKARWGDSYVFETLNCHTTDPENLDDKSGRTANREVTALIRDGAPVEYDDDRGRKQYARVRFIDFDAAEQNTFLAVTQLWIKGIGPAGRFRRPDVLLFVNGIPLVFIELKNSNVNVRDAFDRNLTDYIDYYNVFRNLQKALRDYGEGSDAGDMPVQDKSVLFDLLGQAIDEATKFCEGNGMPLDDLSKNAGQIFKSVAIFGDYADILLGDEQMRKSFYVYENTVTALYDACKPEIFGDPIVRRVAVFQYLRGVVDALIEGQDVSDVQRRITELLDESLVVDDSAREVVKEPKEQWKIIQSGRVWDLSKTNFEKLKHEFKAVEHKNIEIADLLAFIKKKLDEMLKQNLTRRDFAVRLQAIIDKYNSGGSSNENYFDELVSFAGEMKSEDERHVREGLSEDELEIFDLLSKDKMTEAETQKVKLAAKALLKRVLEEHPRVLVEDWFKDAQTRKVVRDALEEVLDVNLPDSYDKQLFQRKRDDVFDAILDYALSGVKFAA